MQHQSAQPDTTSRLVATNISKQFGGVNALEGVHFECGKTEIVGLIGPNGAGKTTLLNVVSALERPDEGRVAVDDRTLTGLAPHDVARHGVARTFQSVRLFGRLTVRQHVEVGVAVARRAHRERTLDADLVLRTLGLFEVADHRARQLPYALQRRVEIARAVALCPDFLLLDEPAAGTSEVESSDLAETIRRVRDLAGCGVVIVEHDLAFVFALSHRLYVLDNGRVLAEGDPAVVQLDPKVIDVYIGSPQTPEQPHPTT
jgi:branched-chain amino acid transport system ATP-binding protein